MVDPDNEERLMKVPRRVVDEIKAEAWKEAQDEIDTLTHGDPCDCAECRVIVMAQKMIANLMDIPARGKEGNSEA